MRTGSVDTREFKEFVKRFDEVIKDGWENELKETTKMLGLEGLRRTRLKTPRRTRTLYNNWRLDNDVKKTGNIYSIELSNKVKYAPYVEYGHRVVDRNKRTIGFVPGRFMMTRSEKEVEAKSKAYVQKRLNQFWERSGLKE